MAIVGSVAAAMENALFVVALVLSATCTVKLNVPGLVAVPEIKPFVASDKPPGKVPLARLHE